MEISFEDGCIQLEHRFFHTLLSQADALALSNRREDCVLTETAFVLSGCVVDGVS
jgi:hypothetical protein